MTTSLEELRNKDNVIDATNGKIVLGKVINSSDKETLAVTDPAFMKETTDSVIKGSSHRTPTIEGSPKQPGLKVVNAKFDPTNAKEFDINSLERRKPEPSTLEKEMMSDLDKAVEREKQSITERIDALTAKQYEEFKEQASKSDDSDIEDTDIVADKTKEDEDDEYGLNDLYDEDNTAPIEYEREFDQPDHVKSSYNHYDPNEDYFEANTNNTYFEEEIDDIEEAIDETIHEEEVNISEDLDKDLAAEIGETLPNPEAIMKEFGDKVKENISPIKKRINFNDFKIGETVITRSEAKNLGLNTVSVADHFLPNAGKIVSCSALSGSELMAMNPENSNRSRLNTLKDIYSIMYKHVVSDKPKTFDEWLKTTLFNDLDHIYFALYKATFAGSHFMHYECPNKKCQDVFIKDIPFSEMINYADEETKIKMQAIMDSGDSSVSDYGVTMHQITDKIAIATRNPSVYNVVIEVSGLSDSFLEKYSDLMDLIVYIDNIYFIDEVNMILKPVDLMPDKNNIAKTVARRIKIISDILRTIPSDNYFELRKCIADTYPSMRNVTYKIPAAKCEKCGTEIPETTVEAQQLLFMRHQLGAFVVL